jgi:hypothetical protein
MRERWHTGNVSIARIDVALAKLEHRDLRPEDIE